MPSALDTIPRSLTRIGAAAQNALEVARFGGLSTDQEASPYEIATEQRVQLNEAEQSTIAAELTDDMVGLGPSNPFSLTTTSPISW